VWYSSSFLTNGTFLGFLIDLPSFIEAVKNDPDGEMINLMIIKACEIVTVTVPPALPTCMQIGISVALTRLNLFFLVSLTS